MEPTLNWKAKKLINIWEKYYVLTTDSTYSWVKLRVIWKTGEYEDNIYGQLEWLLSVFPKNSSQSADQSLVWSQFNQIVAIFGQF